MNTIILLAIIGVGAVSVIAGIVVFQFIQQQQAINKLDKLLNTDPEDKRTAKSKCVDEHRRENPKLSEEELDKQCWWLPN